LAARPIGHAAGISKDHWVDKRTRVLLAVGYAMAFIGGVSLLVLVVSLILRIWFPSYLTIFLLVAAGMWLPNSIWTIRRLKRSWQ